MNEIVAFGLVILVALVSLFSLWDRFRRDDSVQEWMLNVSGLDGLCQDYLDYIQQMSSGHYDLESLHYNGPENLDSEQRKNRVDFSNENTLHISLQGTGGG